MSGSDLMTQVVAAVADEDEKAIDAVDPLHDYIDPEVLARLEKMDGAGDWYFSFPFDGHRVSITEERVLIDGDTYRCESPLSDRDR